MGQHGQAPISLEIEWFVGKILRTQILRLRLIIVLWWFDRAPWRGSDRKCEFILLVVSILYLPINEILVLIPKYGELVI